MVKVNIFIAFGRVHDQKPPERKYCYNFSCDVRKHVFTYSIFLISSVSKLLKDLCVVHMHKKSYKLLLHCIISLNSLPIRGYLVSLFTCSFTS